MRFWREIGPFPFFPDKDPYMHSANILTNFRGVLIEIVKILNLPVTPCPCLELI